MKRLNKSFIIDVAVFIIATSFILWIAWLNYKLFESVVFISVHYFVIKAFDKAFHADSITKTARMAVRLCYVITYLIQFIFVFLLIRFSISYYLNILISILLGYLSYWLQDYLDLKKPNIFKMLEPDLRLYCQSVGILAERQDFVVLTIIHGYTQPQIALKLGFALDTIKDWSEICRKQLKIKKFKHK